LDRIFPGADHPSNVVDFYPYSRTFLFPHDNEVTNHAHAS